MSDIKYFFGKNKKLYYLFCVFVFAGIVFGIVISATSKSYLSLLTKYDNVLIDYVNGDVDFTRQTIKLFSKHFTLITVLFILNLSFWSGLASFLVISYQSLIIYLSMLALCSQFAVKGFLILVFIVLPINLFYLFLDVTFTVIMFRRNLVARKTKNLWYDFDNINFWKQILFFICLSAIVSVVVNILLSLILKSSIFILF